jgi:hypothetical protein
VQVMQCTGCCCTRHVIEILQTEKAEHWFSEKKYRAAVEEWVSFPTP